MRIASKRRASTGCFGMSDPYERVFRKCAECGARCGPTAERCWMCNAPLSPGELPPNMPREATAAPSDRMVESPRDLEAARTGDSTRGTAMLLLIIALAGIGAG